MTDALLYEERRLFETYNKGLSLLPVGELPSYRVFWDRLRIAHEGGAFAEHAPLVEELLDRIRRDGVLSSTDVEPRAAIDWYWRPTDHVRALLAALAAAGMPGSARRAGDSWGSGATGTRCVRPPGRAAGPACSGSAAATAAGGSATASTVSSPRGCWSAGGAPDGRSATSSSRETEPTPCSASPAAR